MTPPSIPAIETVVVDVIEEPVPGSITVTEFEETEAREPSKGPEEAEEDGPAPPEPEEQSNAPPPRSSRGLCISWGRSSLLPLQRGCRNGKSDRRSRYFVKIPQRASCSSVTVHDLTSSGSRLQSNKTRAAIDH